MVSAKNMMGESPTASATVRPHKRYAFLWSTPSQETRDASGENHDFLQVFDFFLETVTMLFLSLMFMQSF